MKISPIDIFDQLPKEKTDIKELRKGQREILEKYQREHTSAPRVGIRLPTGAGKSLIAILILEAWRQSGKTVAIATADKGSAEDMRSRCEEIGVPCGTIFGATGDRSYRVRRLQNLMRYKRKAMIGIFNHHSYLYGTEYKEEISPPDILVIDDAHDFESVRTDFFTIRIDRQKHASLYSRVLNSLRKHELTYPNLPDFLLGSGRFGAVELVHFTHAEDVRQEIQKGIGDLRKTDLTLSLSYDRNLDHLPSFAIFISNSEIELRPVIIPEECLKMKNVPQIIYMSATLYEDEMLHKAMGVARTHIELLSEKDLSKEAFEEIETVGRRLIFPLEETDLSYRINEKCLGIIESLQRIHGKVLVLANTSFDAWSILHYLQAKGIPALVYQGFEESEKFANEMESGALICANRYFGLDFPGDTCRIGIVVRLPRIFDSVDAFQSSVLLNERYAEEKTASRLVQSFGRCNRLVGDEALYYLLDPRIIARLTGAPKFLRHFPRQMWAEMSTGYFMSEGGGIGQALEFGQDGFFGVEDREYREILLKEKHDWSPEILGNFNEKYPLEIQAWNKSINASYRTSGKMFGELAEYFSQNLDKESGQNIQLQTAWFFYLSAMNYFNAYAHYGNTDDLDSCRENLKKSIEFGGASSWFNRLRVMLNDLVEPKERVEWNLETIEIRRIKEQIASDWTDFINRHSSKRTNPRDVFNRMRDLISTGSHGEMRHNIEETFRLMGYKARKGDKEKGEPDTILSSPLTTQKYKVSIEVKSKKEGEEEKVESINQAIGDAGVVRQQNPDYEVFPLLITQKEMFSEKALTNARDAVRLIDVETYAYLLDKLYSRIDRWGSFTTPHQRYAFVDRVLSPSELSVLWRPQKDPGVTKEEIDRIVPAI